MLGQIEIITTYRIDCCKLELTLNPCWSSTPESEMINELSLSGSRGLMNVKLDVELGGKLEG